MKNLIIPLVLAIGLLAGTACSTSREVKITERDRDEGIVIKKEKRVDKDGVVITKSRRDRGDNDRRDRDTRVKIKRDRNGGIFDNDDEPAVIIDRD